MKAVHGTKTKNDREDAYKIARLLRGGNFPLAYTYPAEWRPTRDLLRRRTTFVRRRAELLTHVQNTVTQYNLPPLGRRIDRASNRVGVAEHFPDPAVRRSIEADVELLDYLDVVIKRLELDLERTAKVHDPNTFYLLRTIPGVGKIIAMNILYEVGDIERFDRVQEFWRFTIANVTAAWCGRRRRALASRRGSREGGRWETAT